MTRQKHLKKTVPLPIFVECEVVEGLEDVAEQEVKSRFHKQLSSISRYKAAISFHYSGNLFSLNTLKSIIAAYTVQTFVVPRPKALLGHEHFTNLLAQIQQIIDLHPQDAFQTLHLSAAGSNSSVMQRIKVELAAHLKLRVDEEQGDLLIRIRKNRRSNAWQTLVRSSPRPLVTRSWRVEDMPGALNASVANAMIQLTQPTPTDNFLNVACGSGTLIIERATMMPSKQILGLDFNFQTLQLAQANIAAASVNTDVMLMQANISHLPSLGRCFDVIIADLPFGQLVGTHEENQRLYPTTLDEVARISDENARFVLITHEIRLMEKCLQDSPYWYLIEERMITLRGLHPRIYVLSRNHLQYNRRSL